MNEKEGVVAAVVTVKVAPTARVLADTALIVGRVASVPSALKR
jgi:hypothetical protein